MKITRGFDCMTERYSFDFGTCSTRKGYAQVDTSQDASYFGTWANPKKFQIVCFAEGDITVTNADDAEEFVSEVRRLKAWNEENGHRFLGIDPGFSKKIAGRFRDLGLGDLLY